MFVCDDDVVHSDAPAGRAESGDSDQGHRGDRAASAPAAEAGAEAAQLERDYPVSYSIFAMARVHRAVNASLLAELGLFLNQDIMIMLLAGSEGLPQKTLAATLRTSHATVAKMLARMERAGLVQRRPSALDRRVNLAYLTEDGRALQQQIVQVWARLEHNATSDLSPRQEQEFLSAVQVIRASLDASSSEGDVQPA